MPQSDRDYSLVEHLATKVCGIWDYKQGETVFYPLDSWADAGMVWEKARKMGIYIMLRGAPALEWGAYYPDDDGFVLAFVSSNSAPRAICGAVAMATGWKETEDAK
jgi:hypothetical protein